MKCNYPVKYAAMPIIEQVGWGHGLNELERKYDVVCYIVSKCYLLNDKTKYKENGKSEKEYEVVFPYQKEPGQYYDWERVTPSFNLFTNACTNSNLVERVFDHYEEALEMTKQKNKELYDKNFVYSSDDEISKKIDEFNDRLARYKMLEQQILINTSDLEQSNVKELNNVIRNDKGKIKVLNCNLYQYLYYSSYSNYIVYSISPEQYDTVVTLINNQDISDISKMIKHANPILYHDHEVNKEKIMVINENGNVLHYISEWGTLIGNDEQKIPSVELSAIDDETDRVFTTETLEDIVLSFDAHRNISLNKIQGPVLQKSVFDNNKK